MTTYQLDAKRVIGTYEGQYSGPLFIVIGGIHGNENAGVRALERLFQMIKIEPQRNPSFQFFGTLIGLKGNYVALQRQERFINEDLNRVLTTDRVNQALQAPQNEEDVEINELVNSVHYFIRHYNASKVVLLDLHTTTAFGGIFSITSPEPESEKIAKGLHAPVVRDILKGLDGTTIHYFNTENLGVDTTTIVFEAGQHNAPTSVDHAISAIINGMRSVGCVAPLDVEARHDNLLQRRGRKLPKLVRITYKHHIDKDDKFVMKPGYKNFQPIQKGELLAHDKNGAVYSPMDGLILMPLYQKQGSDGFFIVMKLE
ncbi:MAG: succinylglutamate desuccinylase/aspartoacylase family protein [Saprospiraceae bacterium]|mgnify:CR=1 FL=1